MLVRREKIEGFSWIQVSKLIMLVCIPVTLLCRCRIVPTGIKKVNRSCVVCWECVGKKNNNKPEHGKRVFSQFMCMEVWNGFMRFWQNSLNWKYPPLKFWFCKFLNSAPWIYVCTSPHSFYMRSVSGCKAEK